MAKRTIDRLIEAWLDLWIAIPRLLGILFGLIWYHGRLAIAAFKTSFQDINSDDEKV